MAINPTHNNEHWKDIATHVYRVTQMASKYVNNYFCYIHGSYRQIIGDNDKVARLETFITMKSFKLIYFYYI